MQVLDRPAAVSFYGLLETYLLFTYKSLYVLKFMGRLEKEETSQKTCHYHRVHGLTGI